MIKYLSSKQREDFIMISALLGYLEKEMVVKWKINKHLTSEESKWMKSAITFCDKFITSIMERLEEKHRKLIVRDSKGTEIFCMPKERAQVKIERHKKEQKTENLLVARDAFDKLGEMSLLSTCKPCICKENKKTCEYKDMYLELLMPPYNSEAECHECPYEII